MASAVSAGKQATVSSAGRKAAGGATFTGQTWRRTTTNGREATVWRKTTGNGETNSTAAAGEARRTVDSAGETWRAEHVARETGGATEADDATGNADEAERSAKYTRTAWIPTRAERETRGAAKCILRDHRRTAGKCERQPQLESARETTKRTRASPKSSTAGTERRKKAVIKERAERLAGLEEGAAMRETKRARERELGWRVALVAMIAVLGLTFGCKKPSEHQEIVGPTKFVSPQSAEKALYSAVKAGDTNAVLAIFGPEGKEYLLTEDPAQDKSALDTFAEDYETMHRWATVEGGALVLDIGTENYPFPFPLVKTADGQWEFSSTRAEKEIQARQIGDNELTVIDIVNEMADAQVEYFNTTHDGGAVKQYAQRFVSSEGKHDGLYWKAGEGEAESPLGPLAARASAEGYQRGTKESPQPFHGYFYRILKEQGARAEGGAKSYVVDGKMTRGFAILAYPAEYRQSGVMTFVIGKDGRVFQKDLGAETVATAKEMKAFDPDDTWAVVE